MRFAMSSLLPRWIVPLFLVLVVLSHIAQCAPFPEDYSSTPTSFSTDLSETYIESTTKPSASKEISKLSGDILRLYSAVGSFISSFFPGYSSGNDTLEETPRHDVTTTEAATTTEFSDFDDPSSSTTEDEKRDVSEYFLRYIRDVSTPRSVISSILNEIHGDKGHKLIRQARSAYQNGTVVEFATEILRRARRVAETHQSLSRKSRDASQGRQNLFQGYYDFIINEYSYKFWAVYMLVACALLGYSAVAAIYFSKFNTSAIDYELYDDIARSNTGGAEKNPLGLVGSLVSVRTFQTIMDAINSNKYS